MREECVVAVYGTVAEARYAVESVLDSGLPSEMISLVTKTLKPEEEVREAIESGDEMEKDAAVGAGGGVLVGMLSAAAVSSVTGIGAFIFAGPIVAAGIVGGLLGAAVGWGVHKDHIHYYENKLKEGKVLVIAHGDPLKVAEAERVLQGTQPKEIRLYAESSADAPDIDNE